MCYPVSAARPAKLLCKEDEREAGSEDSIDQAGSTGTSNLVAPGFTPTLTLSRTEWSRFLATETDRLDYPNFKSRVQRLSGSHRHDVYMRVWSAMRGVCDSA